MWAVLVEEHLTNAEGQEVEHGMHLENPCSFVNRVDEWQVRVSVSLCTCVRRLMMVLVEGIRPVMRFPLPGRA